MWVVTITAFDLSPTILQIYFENRSYLGELSNNAKNIVSNLDELEIEDEINTFISYALRRT